MRLFWELTRRSFQRQMTYRATIFAGLFTNFFFGLFRVAVLLALFGNNESVEGYTAVNLITYTALTQSVIGLLSLFGWYDLMNAVYSGEIGTDLLKPMALFNFWLAQDLGRALVHLVLRGLLFMLLFELVYDLAYPETAVQWLILLPVLLLSWLISFGWRFLINIAAFWTPQAGGIGRFGFMLSWFLSGFIMPIGLFPEWVQQLAYLTPFPYLLDVIVELYLGILQGNALLQIIILQIGWAIGLTLLCQLLLKQAVKRLVILGG